MRKEGDLFGRLIWAKWLKGDARKKGQQIFPTDHHDLEFV